MDMLATYLIPDGFFGMMFRLRRDVASVPRHSVVWVDYCTSQLWLVQPGIARVTREAVSTPIRASSDDTAIGALILDAGGRPPAD